MALTSGLEIPIVYAALQRILGGDAARKRVVEEFIRPLANSRVLDLGCGPATLLAYLPDGIAYVGIDSSPAYVDSARRHYGTRGRFVCASIDDVPDQELAGGFDLVLGMGLLHHLADVDAARLVAIAHRWLLPGGHLVTLDCAFHEGQPWLARRLVAADRGTHIRTPEGYRDLLAPRFARIDMHLVTNMLRVPYSQLVLRATKA